jgi:hypothetical protein
MLHTTRIAIKYKAFQVKRCQVRFKLILNLQLKNFNIKSKQNVHGEQRQ